LLSFGQLSLKITVAVTRIELLMCFGKGRYGPAADTARRAAASSDWYPDDDATLMPDGWPPGNTRKLTRTVPC